MDLLNLTIGANNRALRRERIFRDRENPLEILTDEQLYSKFRFTRDGIYFLCANCDGLEQITERSCALSTSLKILVGLRYLATGSFQNVVADTIRISQPTVSRTFSSFLNSIQRLSPRLIKWPTQMEQTATRNHFFENFTLPNVVGCIDCTHIQIRAPEQEEEAAYVNRMSYHSINVQAVCDENSIFINLVANKPGSFHDSTILRECGLYEKFESGERKGVILADSGYPCKRWLIPPFRENQIQGEQSRMDFNRQQKKARALIERAFGQLKRRWASLHTEIRLSPEKAVKMTLAAVALHNLAKKMNMPDFEEEGDQQRRQNEVQQPNLVYRGEEECGMRHLIVSRYF